LARRGRKHKACLLIASQFIDEFLSCEQGRAVIHSADTSILMRQNPAVVDQVVDHFNLAEGTKQQLSSFEPGEAILSLNGNVTGIKVIPIPYEWPYITT
jgi:conjugal transfer ATP-binding protein TraC